MEIYDRLGNELKAGDTALHVQVTYNTSNVEFSKCILLEFNEEKGTVKVAKMWGCGTFNEPYKYGKEIRRSTVKINNLIKYLPDTELLEEVRKATGWANLGEEA